MNVIETDLPGVLVLEPEVFTDDRGFFFESWNARVFREATGFDGEFVQDNHSRSKRGVLRGIHYQLLRPQGKLVRVVSGEVFDVAVDLRRSSPNFGRWTGAQLTAKNKHQLWIPPGFGHAFLALSAAAEVTYKTTEYRYPDLERRISWNDETLAIDWPLPRNPIQSTHDANAGTFWQAEVGS